MTCENSVRPKFTVARGFSYPDKSNGIPDSDCQYVDLVEPGQEPLCWYGELLKQEVFKDATLWGRDRDNPSTTTPRSYPYNH
jgi:hypothetical protein